MLQKYITFMKNGKKEVKKLPIYAEKHYLCAANYQKINNYILKIMKKFILSVMAAAAFACGISSCNNGAPKATFTNGDIDTLSYALGVLNGTRYSSIQDTGAVVPEKVINLDNFLNGFLNALHRDSTKLTMTPEEAQQFLQAFDMKMRKEMEEKRQAEVNANKAKGADFMAENAKKEGVVVTESGLQIETIKEGTGKQAKDGDKVLVNYKGTLIDGTQFDANDSTEFSVNGVVKGFKEGILSMKEGGKAKLTMPSELAYGDRGAGQNIPGGSTLVFDVELLKVIPAAKK